MLVSMTCHEAMHAFMAYRLGDRLAYEEGRISLNPFKHIDFSTTLILPVALIIFGQNPIFIAKPVPFDPRNLKFGVYGMALVGIIGPMTNLLLAIIASIAMHVFSISLGTLLGDYFVVFIEVNVGFFVFNMIPFPPLDGSRLLYAFAPDFLRSIMERVESKGILPIIFVAILLFPVIGPTIGNIENSILQLIIG